MDFSFAQQVKNDRNNLEILVFLYTYPTFNSTTMLENAEGVADTLMKNWFQKCAVGEICNLSYMMHRTLPLDDSAVTGASKNFWLSEQKGS